MNPPALLAASDTLDVRETRYANGVNARYQFSVLFRDWEDWKNKGIPTDIIWQFKHTDGGPDGFFGIKRNSLILRWGKRDQFTILSDIRPYANEWIDIKTDIYWSDNDDETGGS